MHPATATNSPDPKQTLPIMNPETIVFLGDEVLRKKSDLVLVFNDDLANLFGRLLSSIQRPALMDDHMSAVGISAPQIGISVQAVLLKYGKEPIFACNPRIVEVDEPEKLSCLSEGCLSMPGITVPVWRPNEVTVEYQDLTGQINRLAVEGFESRVWQHEIDHLNGILMIDHVNAFRKKEALAKWKKLQDKRAKKARRPGVY